MFCTTSLLSPKETALLNQEMPEYFHWDPPNFEKNSCAGSWSFLSTDTKWLLGRNRTFSIRSNVCDSVPDMKAEMSLPELGKECAALRLFPWEWELLSTAWILKYVIWILAQDLKEISGKQRLSIRVPKTSPHCLSWAALTVSLSLSNFRKVTRM